MGALSISHFQVTNVKLINEKKKCLNITCPGVAQLCWKVVVAWMWSQTDANLSYLCLGAISLLVPETFKFKNFET